MRLIREVRSFYRAKAEARDWGTLALASGAGLAVLAIAAMLVLMPFVEKVAADEIVVCETSYGDGKDVDVWRGDKDPGFHWQGLCRITTYHRTGTASFKEPMTVDGRQYVVHGTASFDLSKLDDARMLEMHRAYGSEAGIYAGTVRAQVRSVLEEAAEDPDWAEPNGNYVERKLKGAFEYGLQRFKLSDGIVTTAKARQGLERELNRRLAGLGSSSKDTPVTVTLRSISAR